MRVVTDENVMERSTWAICEIEMVNREGRARAAPLSTEIALLSISTDTCCPSVLRTLTTAAARNAAPNASATAYAAGPDAIRPDPDQRGVE